MGVAMDPDLVAGIGHRLHLVRKGLDRVAGDEPRGFDAPAAEQLEQARRADLAGEQPAGDVVGRILAPVGAEPPGHRVHIDAEPAQNILRHD